MIKHLLVGIWVCVVTLGSSYAAIVLQGGPQSGHAGDSHGGKGGHGSAKSTSPVEHLKTRIVSVPVVADGAVQGYVVAQFIFALGTSELAHLPIAPEPLLLDESFKAIYAGDTIDFRRFRKQDLPALSKRIQDGANKRFGTQLVQDVLIHDLNYVSKDEARGRIAQ